MALSRLLLSDLADRVHGPRRMSFVYDYAGGHARMTSRPCASPRALVARSYLVRASIRHPDEAKKTSSPRALVLAATRQLAAPTWARAEVDHEQRPKRLGRRPPCRFSREQNLRLQETAPLWAYNDP